MAAFGLATKTMSLLCCMLPWGRSSGARFLTAFLFFFWSLAGYAVL